MTTAPAADTRSLDAVDRGNKLLDSIGRTPERVFQLRNAAIASLAMPDLREVRRLDTGEFIGASLSVAADRYVAMSAVGLIAVHRLSSGELLCSIPDDSNQDNLITLDMSPDGRFVGIVNDRGAKFWCCDREQPDLAWEGPGATCLTFSPDSQQAAVSDTVNGMRLIDLDTRRMVRPLGQGAAQSSFAFHAETRRIAVCTKTGVNIIDWDTGQVLADFPRETAAATGVAWHPGGQAIVVSGLADGSALWDVAERRLLTSYPHRGPIRHLQLSHDGSLLLARGAWSGACAASKHGTWSPVAAHPTPAVRAAFPLSRPTAI